MVESHSADAWMSFHAAGYFLAWSKHLQYLLPLFLFSSQRGKEGEERGGKTSGECKLAGHPMQARGRYPFERMCFDHAAGMYPPDNLKRKRGGPAAVPLSSPSFPRATYE